MKTYRVGDIVDIKNNGAQQKGMAYKVYHGKTGVVYNVTKSAVGIILYRQVGNRYIEKVSKNVPVYGGGDSNRGISVSMSASNISHIPDREKSSFEESSLMLRGGRRPRRRARPCN
jgi:ribosomal protein L21E